MKYLILFFPLIASAQFRPNPVSAPLLNYSVGTNTPLSVSDTILTALQNLQGQTNSRQPIDADLTAIASQTGAGYLVRIGTNSWATRSIIASAGITVADSDAVFGNTSIANTDRGTIAVSAHVALADPHPQYTLFTNFNTLIGSATQTALNGKANLVGGNLFTGSQIVSSSIATTPTLLTSNTATGSFIETASFFAPNMASGTSAVLNFGKDSTANDSSEIRFFYDNDNSSFNRLNFGWTAGNVTASMLAGGQTGFGTETPVASAKVQIDSTTQGFLPPRQTSIQRQAIAAADGLQVYDTELNAVAIYDTSDWTFKHTKTTANVQTSTSTTYVNITELVTATLDEGLYEFQFTGIAQSTAALTGIGLRLAQGTATISSLTINWNFSQGAAGTDKNFEYSQIALADNITSASFQTANANAPVSGRGVFRVSLEGTVAMQIRTENAGTGVSIRPDSILIVRKVN